MEETIQAFLKDLEEVKGRSKNTLTAYRSDLRQFHEALTSLKEGFAGLQDLDNLLLGEYINWLQASGYRASTIARKWAAIHSFLQFLREASIVSGNLGEGLQLKAERRKRPRVLKRSEVDALLSAPLLAKSPMGLRDHALLNLMYAAGMRVGDVVALDMAAVDLERGIILSVGSMAKNIPLGDAVEGLSHYLRQGRPHLVREPTQQALFLNQRGKRLSRQGLWLIVKRWAVAAGLGDDVSPHTLRHSLADHLLQAGMSRKSIQRKLLLRSPNSLRVFIKTREKVSES